MRHQRVTDCKNRAKTYTIKKITRDQYSSRNIAYGKISEPGFSPNFLKVWWFWQKSCDQPDLREKLLELTTCLKWKCIRNIDIVYDKEEQIWSHFGLVESQKGLAERYACWAGEPWSEHQCLKIHIENISSQLYTVFPTVLYKQMYGLCTWSRIKP